MSSATSRPCLWAAPTRLLKSSSEPSSGWIDLWPPSGPPIAQGLPGSSAAEQVSRRLLKRLQVCALGPAGGGLDECRPDTKLDGHVLAGLKAPEQVARPGVEVIHPAFDRVKVGMLPHDGELAPPAIVHD